MSRTTNAIRQAIQQSSNSIRSLAERYGINPKTVAKWRRRDSVEDRKSGPRDRGGSTLTIETQALIVAVRQHMLLPLDDCLTVLQHFVPDLDRVSLYRCLNRHDISRLPEIGRAHV
jgi:transposase-like protein